MAVPGAHQGHGTVDGGMNRNPEKKDLAQPQAQDVQDGRVPALRRPLHPIRQKRLDLASPAQANTDHGPGQGAVPGGQIGQVIFLQRPGPRTAAVKYGGEQGQGDGAGGGAGLSGGARCPTGPLPADLPRPPRRNRTNGVRN